MTRTKDTSRLDYLRHRPFLVITEVTRPGRGVRTETAGWMQDTTNISHQDEPSITQRVSLTMLRKASIIIDIKRGTTIKNRTTDPEAAVIARYRHMYAHLV